MEDRVISTRVLVVSWSKFDAVLSSGMPDPVDTRGIHDTLTAKMVESSTGVAAYVLVEDDAEALKEANQKIDQVLQCFWVSATQPPWRRILMAA